MHVRTWLASSCAVLAMAASLACNGKTSSPVAPDDPFGGSPPNGGVASNAPPSITSVSATPPLFQPC